MWRPTLVKLGKVAVAAVFLSASTSANACLFPCLWGWGWGGYYPPMYSAPAYAPAYSPGPCGPSGCSPCGPSGCSSFYSPQACCAPCGASCTPCGTGCSPCGAGGCPGGNCGVNYAGDMSPQADKGPTKADDKRTYRPGDRGKTSTGGMPDDDFVPPAKGGANGGTGPGDPFVPPTSPASTEAGTGTGEQPPAPMGDEVLPGAKVMQIAPLRTRTIARAQYRVPRVARLYVAPETRWLPASESRLVQR